MAGDNEYRHDGVTGEWVIIAPVRGRRPLRRRFGRGASPRTTGVGPPCPFCPGNEHLLPAILHEMSRDGCPGWYTRVVSNKYPALRPEGDSPPARIGCQARLPGFGYHEVIIETARHDADLTTLSDTGLSAVLHTYRARFAGLSARPGIECVFVFRNRGSAAGASMSHPHSQVIATAIVPPRVAERSRWARERFADTDRCATCSDLEHEIADGRRVVESTDRFLTTVPFAATNPFELRITPVRHRPSFGHTDDTELAELGMVLRRALTRLRIALDDPPYNIVIDSVSPDGCDAKSDHWRLEIVPDLVVPGGFELSSGVPINPSLPEVDAELLRSTDFGQFGRGPPG